MLLALLGESLDPEVTIATPQAPKLKYFRA
jgi:hypothetical protein